MCEFEKKLTNGFERNSTSDDSHTNSFASDMSRYGLLSSHSLSFVRE